VRAGVGMTASAVQVAFDDVYFWNDSRCGGITEAAMLLLLSADGWWGRRNDEHIFITRLRGGDG